MASRIQVEMPQPVTKERRRFAQPPVASRTGTSLRSIGTVKDGTAVGRV